MRPGQAHHRSHLRLFWPIFILAILLGSGCQIGRVGLLPTLVPTLQHSQPSPTSRATRESPPPTYTGVATQDLASVGLPTRIVTVAPQPTFTRAPAPTPLLVAENFPQKVDALYLDTPPAQTDCRQHGLLFRSRFPSSVAGPWRDYHAYLPPCYGQDGRVYPVLYLIHGSIQDDSHWPDLGLVQYLDAGIADGRFPPFIASTTATP